MRKVRKNLAIPYGPSSEKGPPHETLPERIADFLESNLCLVSLFLETSEPIMMTKMTMLEKDTLHLVKLYRSMRIL
jgi:hypothetical protein